MRTQRGNNNAYCQDNDVSWLDWSFAPAARAMLRFTRELIALRKRHPSLRRTRFLNGHGQAASAEIHWYGETPRAARVAGPRSARAVLHAGRRRAAGAGAARDDQHGVDGAHACRCREAATRNWRRIADTTLVAPDDVVPAGVAVPGSDYRLGPHGIAIFEDSRFVVE